MRDTPAGPPSSELWPTLLAFLHFFLIIFSYYIIKPVRDALFIKTIGPDRLPYFYLAVAGVVLLVVAIYNQLLRRFDSRRFVVALQGVVALNILAFWWLMAAGHRISTAFYIWASVYNVLMVTLFWSLTNDLFDSASGRRHYGVIGGGGIVGGIVGGLATRYLPAWIGTTHCLLPAAGVMLLTLPVTLARLARPLADGARGAAEPRSGAERSARDVTARREPREPPESSSAWRDFHLVWSQRNVRLITQIVFFVTLAKTLFNYHYYHVIDATILGTDATTAFFGTVNAASNISSAVLQFLVTTWVLRRFGARVGLLFLPLVLLSALGLLLFPQGLLVIASLNVAQQSTSYSINQSSKELLYTPCTEAVKYRSKAVIDMFVFRFGDAFAALVLLVLHTYLHLPAWTSIAVGSLCTAYWLTVILRAEDPTRVIGSAGGSP